jgi:hypothetical protein
MRPAAPCRWVRLTFTLERKERTMQKRADLEPLIRRAWLTRPAGSRRENDVLVFYGWLQQERPDLLAFRAAGDKYQVLHTILRDLIERE